MPITGKVEAAQSPWPVLGVLLVRDGAITPAQLDAALAAKSETPRKRIGEILVEQGAATGRRSHAFSPSNTSCLSSSSTASMVERRRRRSSPSNWHKRYSAIPVRIQGDSVLVAVADPTNIMNSDDLRLAIGMSVKVVVAPSDAIDFAIRKTLRRRGCPARRRRGGGARERGRRDQDRPQPRITGGRVHQPVDREGPRSRRLGHPLHATGEAPSRSCARRRRHARDRVGGERTGHRRHEPLEDHGRARHRRASRAAGRPRLDPAR